MSTDLAAEYAPERLAEWSDARLDTTRESFALQIANNVADGTPPAPDGPLLVLYRDLCAEANRRRGWG